MYWYLFPYWVVNISLSQSANYEIKESSVKNQGKQTSQNQSLIIKETP